jgi:hypothetical protein
VTGRSRWLRPLLAVVADRRLGWRIALGVLALLVLASLARRVFARGASEGHVLTVRVLAGGSLGIRIEIDGAIAGRSHAEIRDFVAQLDLPPGAVLWVVRNGGALELRTNHRVPAHLGNRVRDFLGTRSRDVR